MLPKQFHLKMAIIALCRQSGDLPCQSHDIAKALGCPRRKLEASLQDLVRQGFLIGWRGPAGGYTATDEGRAVDVYGLWRAFTPVTHWGHRLAGKWRGVSLEEALNIKRAERSAA
jgi:DNA-binding IscR family transcriptional regulator